jgi:cytochrome d ubiquinol oxidase subunit I
MFWHTIFGSIVTSALVVGAVGAFYLLTNRFRDHALIYVKHSIVIGLIFSLLIGFTGSKNGEQVTRVNPAKLAAMEGTFKTEPGAPLALYGIPDTQKGELLDGIEVPGLLSYLAYGNAQAPVKGLNDIPKADRPPVEVTYYAYHVMITIGMLLVLIYIVGALLLLGGVLERSRWFLLLLLLAFPIGYIGDETGWVVAEVGRQPWLINNVLRTAQGTSTNVPQGETIFTLIGFVAIYGLLSVLFLSIIGKMIANGPAPKIAKAQTSKEGAE